MTWPPEGSKPPVPPRPTPSPKPAPTRPSRPASPGETEGETKVKPQATPAAPTPPKFGHDGIDPRRALLILGLPLLAVAGTLLVLFASTTVWWIAVGVAAAGVTGGVVLRRSGRARGLLGRVPGRGRMTSALRRASNGRFARSPLGRVMGRALGRRPAASPGGSPSRPKTLGGRLRSMLPPWAGGTRKARPGGSSAPSSGGRMRSLLSRLKPGGGRRPGASSGGALGGRPGKPGGSSQSGGRTKPGSLLRRAARSAAGATGRASRAVGSKLFGIRPAASPSGAGGPGKPKGKGKNRPSGGSGGNGPTLELGAVWTATGKASRLIGRGIGALLKRTRRQKKTDDQDDFDPDSTYETGIEGEVINGKHTDPELGEIAARARKDAAKRAKKLAKQRARQAEKAKKAEPEWPNVEPHDGSWPTAEPDDGTAPPAPSARSLPAERDHDPPAPPLASPPPHREAPHSTSAKTKHGGKPVTAAKITQQASPSGISAGNYAHHIKTNPEGRATGWEEAADHARRDAVGFDGKADKQTAAAEEFERTGNQVAAAESREKAAQLREDASTCRTIATGYQDEATKEASSAA